jgi:hypothetical protein
MTKPARRMTVGEQNLITLIAARTVLSYTTDTGPDTTHPVVFPVAFPLTTPPVLIPTSAASNITPLSVILSMARPDVEQMSMRLRRGLNFQFSILN